MLFTPAHGRRCSSGAFLFAVLAAALFVGLFVASASASEQHPTLIELESEVMCPTCHTTLDQSDAPIARRIEGYISARIAVGDTKSEIKDKLVAQFGTAILAAPPRKGFDLLAWWLPIVGVVGGALLLALGAYRWSGAQGPTEAIALQPLDAELERRLDQELARFR